MHELYQVQRDGQVVAAPATAEPLSILVIDDDSALASTLVDILRLDGHVVTSAEGGEEGIQQFSAALARKEGFDLVITDLGMPRVDGRAVAKAVKLSSPGTPVLLLTGSGHELAEDAAIPMHVDRMLSKPPKLHELRSTVRALRKTADNRGLARQRC